MEDILGLYQTVSGLSGQTGWPAHPLKSVPPLVPIPVYTSDAELSELSQPFIYRRFPWFPAEPALFEALFCAEKEVYGYQKAPLDNDGDWGLGARPGREIWAQFQSNTLKFNILDSKCSNDGPLLDTWNCPVLNRPPFVGWVLTQAPKRTYFHLDPPYGNCFMYLCRGKKIWLFIAPGDLSVLQLKYDFETINSLSLPDLLLLDDGFLWGKIQIGVLNEGDLLYFPDYWAHYVYTLENSFGYGGYFGRGQDENETT